MKTSRGLSLIEVTIVLVIIGLLLGGLLIPLSAQMDQQKIDLTKKRLEEIKEALLGFAIIYNRLPCVDTNGDGQENKDTTQCDSNGEGYLPWKDLGVGRYDAWGNPFRYQTEEDFNNLLGFNANPTSGLRIKNRNDNNFTNTTDDSYVVAMIFSCGKNGRPDPTNPSPNTIDKNQTNDADGKRNTDASCSNQKVPGGQSKTYIHDVYVENEFDDILTWLSKNTLMNRLVAAGKWPPLVP
ncbi:general secretion pathway protein H [Beggiatoa sp. PS]|nr:general secretion pathway protein H [Beggiatoa sp. PS]